MSLALARRYDAAAGGWGRKLDYLGFPQAYRAMVAEALCRLPLPGDPGRQWCAVDLGAGDGALAEAMDRVVGPGLDLTLVDLSPAMLAAAEMRLGRGRARLIEGDLATPALEAGRFDIVAAAHLLEHLDDPLAGLCAMRALLRPGGVLILSVSRPHWCSRLVWLHWRHRRFAEAEMRAALHQAGFAPVEAWRHRAGPPRRLSLAYAARPAAR